MRANLLIALAGVDFLLSLMLGLPYDSAIWIALVAIFVKMDDLK